MEKLDSEAEWGPPWRTAITGSQASFFLDFDDTNIASKGLLAPEIEIQVEKEKFRQIWKSIPLAKFHWILTF